jgi:hypothetical protein
VALAAAQPPAAPILEALVIKRPFVPAASLCVIVLCFLCAGCSLENDPTRPSLDGPNRVHGLWQKPAPPGAVPSYAAPESCLRAMQIGIERKDAIGASIYLEALADTARDGRGFHAFFDPLELYLYSAGGGTVPPDWGPGHESLFIEVFFRSYPDPYVMQWLEEPGYPIANEVNDGETAVLHRRYMVWARRQADGESRLIAVGYATLVFARISASRWALVRWEDHVDPTIGVLPADPDQRSFSYRRLFSRGGG